MKKIIVLISMMLFANTAFAEKQWVETVNTVSIKEAQVEAIVDNSKSNSVVYCKGYVAARSIEQEVKLEKFEFYLRPMQTGRVSVYTQFRNFEDGWVKVNCWVPGS